VFVPGGRGEQHGSAVDPAELFQQAAVRYAQETGEVVVVLTGHASPLARADAPHSLRLLPRVKPEDVQHLLAGARRVVSNGGTSLVHALAHGKEIVSVALASDQARRIRRAARLGVVLEAKPDPAEIAAAALSLARDPERGAKMRRAIAELGLVNGVDEAVAALRHLVFN
jgi:UDP:flavonoid glycosyltransferase YjiC (YdhE family)